ncbi:TonB-dependent receptor plug domain-containing protein [Cesiribacter andamanensis]|uniref:Outer membrane receptor FepA n=1 Tax=Cesiribacter andamanensis AMV16 TaxID=1279009 RepID=M7NVU9_9BACT|nr:TonB-dependent receptor plug domain-containing protein [Cesiribacter andamanensis]EMR02599.1 outer membrane receptor FepA [Cesiribacter andamanensis AMV16]
MPAQGSLLFSAVGYQPQEVPLAGNQQLEVWLLSSHPVAIGYGTIERTDLVGAVASAEAAAFNEGLSTSPEQLVQGRLAGVQISTASGEPGAGAAMVVRGLSSIRGGAPLYVVDGMPLSDNPLYPGGVDLGFGTTPSRNGLNFLNPDDIQRIDVLKDAAAAAIYGARAANGVVLITTKSGTGQRHQLSYAPTLSVSRIGRQYELLNREQF